MLSQTSYLSNEIIYVKPKENKSSKQISNLTKLVSPNGKGIIEGFVIAYDEINDIVTVYKGKAIIDNTIVVINDDITFNLHDEMEHEFLNGYPDLDTAITSEGINRVYLILYYEHDESTTTQEAYYELRSNNNYNPNDPKQLMLYFWDVNVV